MKALFLLVSLISLAVSIDLIQQTNSTIGKGMNFLDNGEWQKCGDFLFGEKDEKGEYIELWTYNKFDAENCAFLQVETNYPHYYTHCCRIKRKADKAYSCIPVTDDQYEHMRKYKRGLKEWKKGLEGGVDIDCFSNFVKLSFALLALFLL